jgi:MYND finger
MSRCEYCDRPCQLQCNDCAVPYCGKQCQASDWPEHALICDVTIGPIKLSSKKWDLDLQFGKGQKVTQEQKKVEKMIANLEKNAKSGQNMHQVPLVMAKILHAIGTGTVASLSFSTAWGASILRDVRAYETDQKTVLATTHDIWAKQVNFPQVSYRKESGSTKQGYTM